MMHCQRCLMISVAFLACFGATPVFSEDIISFSNLPPGDTLKVRLYESGCFNQSAHKFVFHSGSRRMVDIYERPEEMLSSDVEKNWVRLGNIELSSSDLHGLDKQLAYYREKHGGGCTSSTDVSLTQFREGKDFLSEHWTDLSCQASVERRTDILWFGELIYRVYLMKKER